MSIAQSLLPEFEQEMANTRKVLERVPDEKWNWKPHDKSGTTGWLAAHVGTVPGWLTMTLNSESLDYAPVDGPSYTPPKIENSKQLLAAFDKESAEARAALTKASDQDMMQNWSLLAGGKEIFTMPRVACVRGNDHESSDSSSRPTDSLSPSPRRAGSRSLRPLRRRTVIADRTSRWRAPCAAAKIAIMEFLSGGSEWKLPLFFPQCVRP
jgi:hypothetical protein